MEKQEWIGKTGPKRKDRTTRQFTITLPPDLYDELMTFMQDNDLTNRSGTIASLIRHSLLNSLPYA